MYKSLVEENSNLRYLY